MLHKPIQGHSVTKIYAWSQFFTIYSGSQCRKDVIWVWKLEWEDKSVMNVTLGSLDLSI